MRKKRFVSMLSVLTLLIGITLVTAGCGQANGNTRNNANQNSNSQSNNGAQNNNGNNQGNNGNQNNNGNNQSNNDSQNSNGNNQSNNDSQNSNSNNHDNNDNNQSNNGNTGEGLNIQPTSEADPALKGTMWNLVSSDGVRLYFAGEGRGNTVAIDVLIHGLISGLLESVYTVQDLTVSFDFSKSVKAWTTMTVDTYINWEIVEYNKYLAELEDLLKKEQDAAKKKEYEKAIKEVKEYLKTLKNPSPEFKDEIAKDIESCKKFANALEPYAKFDGTLNVDKTQLTIANFPVRNKDDIYEIKEAVFKKK